jgi:ubiquinol-cytochrome c reductase cytochrome b subunit
LYVLHILLVPGLILALVTIHLILVWYQKHTNWGGAGTSNETTVGYPLFPVYTAKAGGYFFVVFGVIVLLSATIQILPLWLFGPYDPSVVSAGTQPDWYVGFLDGALRIMPNWEFYIAGYPISLNVLVPAVLLPGIILTPLLLYPWLEQWVTGDKREHHVLDRPRNQPVRTGIGVAFITFYLLLWISGGNDFVATIFNVPVMWITRFMQVAVIVLPPLMFWVTKRICLGLQRRDRDRVLHGSESGVIVVSPDGEFSEVHAPLAEVTAYRLTAHERQQPFDLGPETDEYGIPAPRRGGDKLRSRLSKVYFADVVQKPTREELEMAHHDGHGAAEAHGEIGAGRH